MKCIYSEVCKNKKENCEASCFRYIKFNKLIAQLNVVEDFIYTDLGEVAQQRRIPISEYFTYNPLVTVIFFDDFYTSQFIMTKIAMYLINRNLMPMNKMPKILNITFNDVVQTYFNQSDYTVNEINNCEMLVLQEYYTITSPTGRDKINELIITRASKKLFTILIFDKAVDRKACEDIKRKLTNLKIRTVTFDDNNIDIKGAK